MMSALKTIVHVESLRRFCRVRNISATPASPAWVATRMCSTYLALGGASCFEWLTNGSEHSLMSPLALIFVPPLTDFSKDADMADGRRGDVKYGLGYLLFTARLLVLKAELEGFSSIPASYHESPDNGLIAIVTVGVVVRPSSGIDEKRTCRGQGARSGVYSR